jgi:hypothetical protein
VRVSRSRGRDGRERAAGAAAGTVDEEVDAGDDELHGIGLVLRTRGFHGPRHTARDRVLDQAFLTKLSHQVILGIFRQMQPRRALFLDPINVLNFVARADDYAFP